MPISVPPNTPIPLRAVLPPALEDWPGPHSWTPSEPEHATVKLSDDDPFGATLSCSVQAPDVNVRIVSGQLVGTSDNFHVDPAAAVPAEPVLVALK